MKKIAEGAKPAMKLAVQHGFTVTYKEENNVIWYDVFKKGAYHVWRIRDGWRTAVLSPTRRYTQHQTFPELVDALNGYKPTTTVITAMCCSVQNPS